MSILTRSPFPPDPSVPLPPRPSVGRSWLIFIIATGLMIWVRIFLFPHRFVALSYGLALLLCLWHRDRRLLWAMATAFVGVAAYKAFWLAPIAGEPPALFQLLMQVINIGVIAWVVHLVINLAERLQTKNARLAAANEQLQIRQDQITRQNEELQSQSEELAQQNESLQQQSEELDRQTEELRSQAEDLHSANRELDHRESMLQTILVSLHGAGGEQRLMQQVCDALLQLAGGVVQGAAVLELEDDHFVVRTHAGPEGVHAGQRLPAAKTFASLIMAQNRTGFVDDIAARPDLVLPASDGRGFRSVLATPLRVAGKPIGALEVYSKHPRQWAQHHFRIIEWAAAQCALALEMARLQDTLRRNEAQLRAVIENLTEGLFVTDLHGQLLHCNRAALEMHGAKNSEEWQGRIPELTGLFELCALNGEPLRSDQFPLARLLRGEGVRDLELRIRRPGESWQRIFNYGGSLVRDQDDHPVLAVLTLTDITERKQAEERAVWLASFSERSPNPIVEFNLETGAIQYINPVATYLFPGLGSDSFHHPWLTGLEQEARSLLQHPHPEAAVRREVFTDGRWYSQTISHVPQTRCFRLQGTDITEQKQLEQALRDTRDDLAQANASLERKIQERTAKLREAMAELEHFSYTITHDMRAPLRAIQGFSLILSEQGSDSEERLRQDYLQRICNAANRMDKLITDALDYSRVVREEFKLAPIDINALLRGILDSYPQFQPPEAEVQVDGPLPTVLGNEAGLTQCISNLLNNAVKFVKPGQQPKVRIWAEKRKLAAGEGRPFAGGEEPSEQAPLLGQAAPGSSFTPQTGSGSVVRIWIEDNGIGIPREYQDKIWGMFQKLHRDYEGTGIGLALVRKVLQRLGGAIGVESESGQGSRFWIELQAPSQSEQATKGG